MDEAKSRKSREGIPRPAAKHKHFTDKNVKKLPVKAAQYMIWDVAAKKGADAARGLGILVSPTGTKSYRCAYYYKGSPKARFMHLGRVGEMSLEEARRKTREARDAATKGFSPEKERPSEADNFKVAVESYIKHEQKGRFDNKSAEDTEKVIKRACVEWLPLPVSTIRYDQVNKLLRTIRDGDLDNGIRPRRYLANRLYSHLRGFFSWCVRERTIEASPMADMDKPFENEQSRNRSWFRKEAADKAIKVLWKAADDIEQEGRQKEGRYLKLMIILAKRKTALLNMRWEEIEDDWYWDAPPSDSPNKLEFGRPLPKLAQRVLGRRQKQGRVFGGGINLDRLQEEIRERTRDVIQNDKGEADYFWHGSRHIAETKMAELRDREGRSLILPHIRDLLQDHASKRGSGQTYDHHDYKPETATAMEIWAGHIERLITQKGAAVRLR